MVGFLRRVHGSALEYDRGKTREGIADSLAIKEFGAVKDGRLFPNERGDVLRTSSYWRVWQEARPIALLPSKTASPLAHRPYDLRHTCITNWLNAGVPAAEVARGRATPRG